MFGFQITFKDIIDILLVAMVLYETFRLLKRSGVVNVFWGIFAFLMLWYLSAYVFRLELMGGLLSRIMDVGAIALIIIFQDEIRIFFSRVGARFSVWRQRKGLKRKGEERYISTVVQPIIEACKHFSKSKTGALIVLSQTENLDTYIATGERLDAKLSNRLIENIFFKNTPLHDGAMIVQNDKIVAAGCILPVSKSQEIPDEYGLRHRSALGMAEKTDAIIIIVSEESGHIALAKQGAIRELTIDELRAELISRN